MVDGNGRWHADLDVVGPEGGRIEPGERDDVRQQVRDAALRVIRGKGNTNLAIGLATAHIARAISATNGRCCR